MQITTKFSPGDKGWVFNGERVEQLTIGQVRVIITDSPGIPGQMFNNFLPQKGQKEEYMCVETGIGSGSVYTLGEHIFETKQDCEAAFAERLARLEERRRKQEQERRDRLLSEEEYLRLRLAEVERAKAEAALAKA